MTGVLKWITGGRSSWAVVWIYGKTNGRFDIAEIYQEKRLCREFEVTVVNV